MGPEKQITHNNGEAVDCASARFIIEMAHKYDEPIYIITTGPCSSAVNACLMDPTIMDKIVVVWLGGNCLTDDYVGKPFHEWNMHADFKASQLLLDMDIPLIMLPCDPVGSVKIEMKRSDIDAIEGRNTPAQLLKQKLPRIDAKDADFAKPTWRQVMCDYMGVAALTLPDAMQLDIIPAPKLCDDRSYAIDESRRKIIWGTYPDSDAIVADATKALNNVVKNFPYDFGDYI
jgi:inosine-uridine nucleoside N-ribohydrolase